MGRWPTFLEWLAGATVGSRVFVLQKFGIGCLGLSGSTLRGQRRCLPWFQPSLLQQLPLTGSMGIFKDTEPSLFGGNIQGNICQADYRFNGMEQKLLWSHTSRNTHFARIVCKVTNGLLQPSINKTQQYLSSGRFRFTESLHYNTIFSMSSFQVKLQNTQVNRKKRTWPKTSLRKPRHCNC